LKDLDLYVFEDNISAENVFEIFKDTVNLSRLRLYIMKVEVNDQLLKDFEKNVLPKMTNLKQLHFEINKGITKEGKSLLAKLKKMFPYNFEQQIFI